MKKTSRTRALLLSAAMVILWACRPQRPVTPPISPPPSPSPLPSPSPSPSPTAGPSRPSNVWEGVLSPLTYAGEKHLANVTQLTFGGENAEGYWSRDGKKLIFQSTRPPFSCDQIFVLDLERPGQEPVLVSTGKGRTTCAYFFPDGRRILYSSTHLAGQECPTPPDRSHGYVWGVFPGYDVFTAARDGSDLTRITSTPAYDAEATISTDGSRIVFTSARDDDLELYSMAADGSDVRRLTHAVGYDGGAFFSDDGDWIVYRASHPEDEASIAEFKALLQKAVIRPTSLELHVMRADGSDDRQVTRNGAANFAPFFFRGGHEKIIFCSNLADPKGRNFDLFSIDADGTGLERITFGPTFDGFPMFSPDGRRLAFCSNRHNAKPGETNLFVADWVP